MQWTGVNLVPLSCGVVSANMMPATTSISISSRLAFPTYDWNPASKVSTLP